MFVLFFFLLGSTNLFGQDPICRNTAQALEQYRSEQLQHAHNPVFKVLPKNLSEVLGKQGKGSLYPAFETLREFMNDREKFFQGMQALEAKVLARAETKGIEPNGDNLAAILPEILQEQERALGFAPMIQVARYLDQSEFSQMLRNGQPFVDLFSTDHGKLNHRLQLYVWSAHLAEVHGKDIPLQLYKELGNRRTAEQLNWKDTGWTPFAGEPEHLWGALFDNFRATDAIGQTANFTSPDYLSHQRRYFPGLGNWK